jgi:methionine sulfoxide reductase catalytic subunit
MRHIHPSEITPEALYLSRRRFMAGLGALAAGTVAAACRTGPSNGEVSIGPSGNGEVGDGASSPGEFVPGPVSGTVDELGSDLTPYADVATYNNYYEFSTNKQAVARLAQDFPTEPWTMEVGGLVGNPRTYTLDDLRGFTEQERIYRLRCVEGWSMVIPWLGFPLHELLAEVQPLPEAQYVRFETIHAPEQMPGQGGSWFEWPYVEGLRIDEALHDLTLLSTGLYGKSLLPQNGAPIRLVTPWKYGFKSVKAIVKIDLVATQPSTFWMEAAPKEYGFYANVNPDVPHPRWSQSSERRIGELRRRLTDLFNGYADEVAHLYEGMDLRVHF